MVREHVAGARVAVSVAKGLEPETGSRISQVYAEAPEHRRRRDRRAVPRAGARGRAPDGGRVGRRPTSRSRRRRAKPFDGRAYQLLFTDDVIGVELCSMMKNVAAIGLGLLDGIGKAAARLPEREGRPVHAGPHEIVVLVTALGGRAETAMGLAGIGDQLVTSLGGRNRLYGELVGAGDPPLDTLRELEAEGLTVEGVASTKDVRRLADEQHVDLPFHEADPPGAVRGARPHDVLEVLR